MYICIFPSSNKNGSANGGFLMLQLFDSWRVSNIFIALIFSWLSFSWLLEERTGTSRITKLAPLLCHSMPLLWRTKTSALDCPCASTVHFLHHGSYKHDHVLVGNGCPLWNLMICIYIYMHACMDRLDLWYLQGNLGLARSMVKFLLAWEQGWVELSQSKASINL